MESTYEMAGILISVVGALFLLLAYPLPRQIHRWHIHTLEHVEPEMLTGISCAIGFALFVLGLVTIANPG